MLVMDFKEEEGLLVCNVSAFLLLFFFFSPLIDVTAEPLLAEKPTTRFSKLSNTKTKRSCFWAIFDGDSSRNNKLLV